MKLQRKIKCTKGHTSIVPKDTVECPLCHEKVCLGWSVSLHPGKISDEVKARTFSYILDKYDSIYHYQGIAEMWYTDKPAFADNWNDYPNGFTDWLGSYFDADILWSDEWSHCSECYKAVRTSPDNYSWQASYVWVSDCEILCHECIENDPDSFIDKYKNSTDYAAPDWSYPLIEAAGFVCYSPDEYCSRFQTGFHPGQNDDPKDVAEDIEENLPGYDYIFKIDSSGQFDLSWSVYIRKPDEE